MGGKPDKGVHPLGWRVETGTAAVETPSQQLHRLRALEALRRQITTQCCASAEDALPRWRRPLVRMEASQ
jgi:hypothetical protein